MGINIKAERFSIEELNQYTVLELLMVLVDHYDELVAQLSDVELERLIANVLAEYEKSGKLAELVSEQAYNLLVTRIGETRDIEEFSHYVVNNDWSQAIQKAFDQGVKTLVFSKKDKHYLVSTQGQDSNGRPYAVKVTGSDIHLIGKNGATIDYDATIATEPNIFYFYGGSNLHIEGLKFLGAGTRSQSIESTPLYTGACVFCENCHNVLIEGIVSRDVCYQVLGFNCRKMTVKQTKNTHKYYREPFQAGCVPYAFVQFHSCYDFALLECEHWGGCRDGDVAVFGGGGKEARIIGNSLHNCEIDGTPNASNNVAQAICNDQGSRSCLIKDNFIEGYYYGIDMKADVQNCICENNIIRCCKYAIADRKGESTTVYQTQDNVIRGNKIIFKSGFSDNEQSQYGAKIFGILCENRQGCWVENNELTISNDTDTAFSDTQYIMGIAVSQEDINQDNLYTMSIKNNKIKFVNANGASFKNAPKYSTFIRLEGAKNAVVSGNELRGSYNFGGYTGVAIEGDNGQVVVKDNVDWYKDFEESGLIKIGREARVDTLISDETDQRNGLKVSDGAIGNYQRHITPMATVGTTPVPIANIGITAGVSVLLRIGGVNNWSGIRHVDATFLLTRSASDTTLTKVSGDATGYTFVVNHYEWGCSLNVTTTVDDVPNNSFVIEVIQGQHGIRSLSVNV